MRPVASRADMIVMAESAICHEIKHVWLDWHSGGVGIKQAQVLALLKGVQAY